MKKRLWYLVLGALFLSTLVPAPALGADAGDFVVTGDTDFSYDAGTHVLLFDHPGTYTVSMKEWPTTTNDKIQINTGTAAAPVNLTLNNVGINGISNGFCAFDLQNTSYVNLTLEGTSNLISGDNFPGIACLQGATITIGGSGSLLARGGGSQGSGGRGAGIGGGASGNGGTVTITGGMVGAVGGDRSAGIGGGASGNGGTVTISGGTVIAGGGIDGGAGIGGGASGNGGTVYISGGSVKATGIHGGEPIGMGYAGSDNGTLTDGPGGADIYLTTVTLDGVGPSTAIHSLTTSTSYGINGMQTDSNGKLYLYLPESTHTTAAQTTDGGSPATIRDYAGGIVTNVGGSSGTLLLDTGGNTQHTGNTQNNNPHTLTNNATGLSVSGPGIRGGTKLIVEPLSLHEPGQCAACDAIRQQMADSGLTVLFDADLSLSRSYSGGLTITIPVGAQYDGQTLTLLHCHDGVLEALTTVVENGQAVFTVSGLSPVALVADTAAIANAANTEQALDNIPITGESESTLVWWALYGMSATGIAVLIAFHKRKLSRQ